MHISLIAVGRMKQSPEKDLMGLYIDRCPWPVKIIEVEEKRKITGAERQAREADLLLGAVPDGAIVIALDERGKDITSRALSEKIAGWQDRGISDLVFMIGGADGYDPKVRARADFCLSFGKLTWPHMMVRAMFAEQLYRAAMIIKGHPYHKE